MRYRLRTLLIVLAIAPAIIAGVVWLIGLREEILGALHEPWWEPNRAVQMEGELRKHPESYGSRAANQ